MSWVLGRLGWVLGPLGWVLGRLGWVLVPLVWVLGCLEVGEKFTVVGGVGGADLEIVV